MNRLSTIFTLLCCVAFSFSCGSDPVSAKPQVQAERGKVIEVTPSAGGMLGKATITQAELDVLFTLPNVQSYLGSATARNGISIYTMKYVTVDPDNNPVVASGALIVPTGVTSPAPLLSDQHGTIIDSASAPSLTGGSFYAVYTATQGYVSISPDYLGYGASSSMTHPYLHAPTMAASVIDMLRAARTWCDSQNIALNGKVFLTGYSEGGYATMAAHREIERSLGSEFTCTAVAPMAGPYDLSGLADSVMKVVSYPYPSNFALLALAYDEVYDLNIIDDMFQEPYATQLKQARSSLGTLKPVLESLPSELSAILKQSFIDDFVANPNNRFRQRLRENNVYQWKPSAPVRLFHCTDDDMVPYYMTSTAYDAFVANGATQVSVYSPTEGGGHTGCSVLQPATVWLESFR